MTRMRIIIEVEASDYAALTNRHTFNKDVLLRAHAGFDNIVFVATEIAPEEPDVVRARGPVTE